MGYRMYLSFLLLATFSSSFIPNCQASTFSGQCNQFGVIDGQLKTVITWECFSNNTKVCTTMIEDCTSCDGHLSGAALTCPSNVCTTEEPKTQAGRLWGGHKRVYKCAGGLGRFRFKREISARRHSPMFGRGEIEASDKIIKEAKVGKELVDTGKREADAGKEDIESVKGETTEVKVGKKAFTCDDFCLEKDGKYATGRFEYNYFTDCEGGAKTEEVTDNKEDENKDETKNDTDQEAANNQTEKDKDEQKLTNKEVKDEKKENARKRRMRRFRF